MNDRNDSIAEPESVPVSLAWPHEAFSLHDVQTWVASVLALPAATTLVPVSIYASYSEPPDHRLTARLALTEGTQVLREVVFKGSHFPLLAGSARAHALVSRCCTGMVPHVLAWEDDSGGMGSSRLLYEPFDGRSVGDNHDSAGLIEIARTMAKIQTAVAASEEVKNTGIPQVGVEDIPKVFDAVFMHIEANRAAWQTDRGYKLSTWLGFPAAEILDILDAIRPEVARCTDEVVRLRLSNTIDHGDLHGGNAVIQKGGAGLIYDWETATVGCPLFSVEKLTVAAWARDENPDGCGPWGYVPGTPTQALVRDAYLNALGRTDIPATTFTAALCLATIKEMSAEIAWANLMGWPDGNPEWTAQLVSRMRHHLRGAGLSG